MGTVLTQACRKCLRQNTWTSSITFKQGEHDSIHNIVQAFAVPHGYAYNDSTWICGHCQTTNRYVCIYPLRRCKYCETDLPEGAIRCENCGAPLILQTIQQSQITFIESEKKKSWL